jgi:hypothetical protein
MVAGAMRDPGSSRRTPRPGRWAVLLLLLAGVLALADGGTLLHLHEADSPGYYNPAHVLESAAAAGAAPLPETPAPAEPVTEPGLLPCPTSPPRPACPGRAGDPRAPPLG